MKLARILSGAVLFAAPLALAVFTACTTTSVVDLSYDGGVDSAAPEAAAPAAPDAAAQDAAVDAAKPDDGKCHPKSSAGLAKAPYAPPTGGYQGVCTDALITAYVDCRNGKASACALLDANADAGTGTGSGADAGSSCRSCIESRATDPAWGPIVISKSSFELNEAGCGALQTSDTGKTGCGQGLADYTACLQYTCGYQCMGNEYFACATEARDTECKSVVNGLKATCTADLSQCFAEQGDTTETLTKRIIKRFCGSP
jgi:hypothetical protein